MLFQRRQPIDFVEKIRNVFWPRCGLRRAGIYHWHRLTRLGGSPHGVALGFSVGAFASFSPLMGLHIVMAWGIAFAVRGSAVAAVIGTAVGNPLTYPLIWLASYRLGSVMLGRGLNGNGTAQGIELASLGEGAFLQSTLLPMVIGGTTLGVLVGAAAYILVRNGVLNYQLSRRLRLRMKKTSLSYESGNIG